MIILWVLLFIAVAVMVFVFWALSQPLPEWYDLHGEEYKKYKAKQNGHTNKN